MPNHPQIKTDLQVTKITKSNHKATKNKQHPANLIIRPRDEEDQIIENLFIDLELKLRFE